MFYKTKMQKSKCFELPVINAMTKIVWNPQILQAKRAYIQIIFYFFSEMPSLQMEVCAGCQQPIEDRYLLKVQNQNNFWHETCMICAICRLPLQGSCFMRDSVLYCKQDYDQ